MELDSHYFCNEMQNSQSHISSFNIRYTLDQIWLRNGAS